ncbi:MAG: hypothetical protein E7231_16775 [Cellulosilyticum sp.]|nr:hypothetical protein [Cellulosilyticum sp.]
MKNIDKELINWAVEKIKKDYKEDVALLIGQKGACKIPTDEQNVAFDFYVPCTDRGYQLAKTFIIEDMGYDLFPMSWERLEGIADLHETITFAFANGVILYARTKEDEERFLALQALLKKRLENRTYCMQKALEQLDVAMDIFKTMVFDEDMSHVRKAAGGIMQYLSIAVATFNGTYLGRSYGAGQYVGEVASMNKKPNQYEQLCNEVILATTSSEIKEKVYKLIQKTRNFFALAKGQYVTSTNTNYEELGGWYYEARYTFRRLEYFCNAKDYTSAYELGCYLQIEFDAIQEEFGLKIMDLMGVFDANHLMPLLSRAKELENYIVETLKLWNVELKIYSDLESFLAKEL